MADLERQACFVGQLLKFDLEQAHTRTVRAAAVRRDHQPVHVRIALAAHHIQPARIELTANCAVSLLMPTLTQPVFAVTS